MLAAQQHVVVHFVEPGQGLDNHAGVVALLAREAPWMAPPERVLTASFQNGAVEEAVMARRFPTCACLSRPLTAAPDALRASRVRAANDLFLQRRPD